MDSKKILAKTIDDYIAQASDEVKHILRELRKIIKEEVPEVEESISYGMPAFKLKGKALVYFAGWKDHIGFYPTPSGTSEFQKELARYKAGKGSVQLPLNEPMPMDLIRKIVRFRKKELT